MIRLLSLVLRLARTGLVDNDLASSEESPVYGLDGLLRVGVVDLDETEAAGPTGRPVGDDAAALYLDELAECLGQIFVGRAPRQISHI